MADNQSNPSSSGSHPDPKASGTQAPNAVDPSAAALDSQSDTQTEALPNEANQVRTTDHPSHTAEDQAKSPTADEPPGAIAGETSPEVAPKPARKAKAKAPAKPAAKPKPKPKPKAAPTAALNAVYAPARAATAKPRHWMLLISFLLCVGLPLLLSAGYLWVRAVDQYSSSLGFTVRREEAPSAVDILGGLSKLSSGSSSDSDILYKYIQSQELIQKVDARLNLRSIYARHSAMDPLFSLAPDSSIEDLVDYWQKMVLISYSPGTGLIEVQVKAFTAQEAHEIAKVIFDESSVMINELTAIAREDAMRYAREELDTAVDQLKIARQALTAFRSKTQIVDPSADIQLQMGLLNTLQQQLGTELIDYDLLLTSVQEGDPRLQQSQQRINAIRARIQEERDKFGGGSSAADGEDYATLVAEFERLSVDQEFAEQKYTGALQNYDIAQAEAQRQSRYLAAYLNPTLAQNAEYPRRLLLLGLVTVFLTIAWATLALILYSIRDRR